MQVEQTLDCFITSQNSCLQIMLDISQRPSKGPQEGLPRQEDDCMKDSNRWLEITPNGDNLISTFQLSFQSSASGCVPYN